MKNLNNLIKEDNEVIEAYLANITVDQFKQDYELSSIEATLGGLKGSQDAANFIKKMVDLAE